MKKYLLTLFIVVFTTLLYGQIYDDIYYRPSQNNYVVEQEPTTIIVNNYVSFENRINRFHRNNFKFHVTYHTWFYYDWYWYYNWYFWYHPRHYFGWSYHPHHFWVWYRPYYVWHMYRNYNYWYYPTYTWNNTPINITPTNNNRNQGRYGKTPQQYSRPQRNIEQQRSMVLQRPIRVYSEPRQERTPNHYVAPRQRPQQRETTQPARTAPQPRQSTAPARTQPQQRQNVQPRQSAPTRQPSVAPSRTPSRTAPAPSRQSTPNRSSGSRR